MKAYSTHKNKANEFIGHQLADKHKSPRSLVDTHSSERQHDQFRYLEDGGPKKFEAPNGVEEETDELAGSKNEIPKETSSASNTGLTVAFLAIGSVLSASGVFLLIILMIKNKRQHNNEMNDDALAGDTSCSEEEDDEALDCESAHPDMRCEV